MAEKVAKEDANYRKGAPQRQCSQCTHFRRGLFGEDDGCTVVAGKIEGGMVSDYFRRG